ncbi:MAG: MoaD family protein [Dehalococcoidia bacterium]|nr:MoaD family protein [Dehalococcoidia bacterium]
MTSATAPTINVRVTAVLQKVTGGQKTVEASGSTVSEVFNDIDAKYPGFKAQVYGPDGKLHRFVNIYLNDEDIRYTGGVETALKAGDTLDVLPALAGGCRKRETTPRDALPLRHRDDRQHADR